MSCAGGFESHMAEQAKKRGPDAEPALPAFAPNTLDLAFKCIDGELVPAAATLMIFLSKYINALVSDAKEHSEGATVVIDASDFKSSQV